MSLAMQDYGTVHIDAINGLIIVWNHIKGRATKIITLNLRKFTGSFET